MQRVAIAVALVAVAGAAVAGYRWQHLQPQWQTHTSTYGQYRVELPAAPRADMVEVIGNKILSAAQVEGTVLVSRSEEYVVVYTPDNWVPASLGPIAARPNIRPYPQFPPEPESVCRSRLVELGRLPGIQKVTVGPARRVAGRTVMDAELELINGGIGLARVDVSASRVYVLTACGPASETARARFRRFLDSFTPDP
ncbi:MAG TPA: hypothetical protein VGE74_10710 [Gemmata sp.]